MNWLKSAGVTVAMTLLLGAAASAETESSLRLLFDVSNGEWQLQSVTRLPEPARAASTDQAGDAYVTVESASGEVLFRSAIGRPGLYFYDYLDTSGALAGGAKILDSYTLNLQIPDIAGDFRVRLEDGSRESLFETDSHALRGQLAKRRVIYPIYALDTLVYSGNPANKVDLVILAESYIREDTSVFLTTSTARWNYLLWILPYVIYSGRFNVYAITTISNERGSDHPSMGLYRDTYFDSEYEDRLIFVNTTTAFGVADEHVPQFDELWMLVQDQFYGGAGYGELAVSCAGDVQVLMHEFGHSLGYLWDEYSYGGTGQVGNAPNCDDHAVLPKWQPWIDIHYPGVGTYLGCSCDNAYRPTSSGCMMLSLTDALCIVCIEQLINRIYYFAGSPIDFTIPEQATVISPEDTQTFVVSYANRSNHRQLVSWYVDSQLDPTANDSSFVFAPPDTGWFDISVVLKDTTNLALNLSDSARTTSYSWLVDVRTLYCGDADTSGVVDISDAVYLIGYIFGGGPPPAPMSSGDVSCDEFVDISDAVYLIAYIFAGGPEPCSGC